MSPQPPPSVQEILNARSGEEMALNDRYLNPQMGRIVRTLGFDKVWTGGEGAHLVDSGGQRYLDLFGGYGVFAVGRNHPEVIEALEQVIAARTGNLPQLGVTLLSGVLAEQLLARAPGSVAAMVPANTGTEAVEAAIKIARAATGRARVLYAEHAFHGLTLGSLSLNGGVEFREGFGPLLPGCEAVGFGDLEALEHELSRGDVAAFVVEPIQGKGVNLPPAGYLAEAQRLCRQAGALFVCDEVQTGIARTGRFLDMVCVAKALSGGFVPIGAVLVSRAAFDSVFDGMERAVRHGSTFGGNDLAAAAALATLRVIDREGLLERAARVGALLMELTEPLVERFEVVSAVRGMGRRHRAAAVGARRAPPARALLPVGDGAALPRAQDLLPGGGPSHERDQGAARAHDRGVRGPALRRRPGADDRGRRALPRRARALRDAHRAAGGTRRALIAEPAVDLGARGRLHRRGWFGDGGGF